MIDGQPKLNISEKRPNHFFSSPIIYHFLSFWYTNFLTSFCFSPEFGGLLQKTLLRRLWKRMALLSSGVSPVRLELGSTNFQRESLVRFGEIRWDSVRFKWLLNWTSPIISLLTWKGPILTPKFFASEFKATRLIFSFPCDWSSCSRHLVDRLLSNR